MWPRIGTRGRYLVKITINFHIPLNVKNIYISRKTITFSRKTCCVEFAVSKGTTSEFFAGINTPAHKCYLSLLFYFPDTKFERLAEVKTL
jgi:hypothetical protein